MEVLPEVSKEKSKKIVQAIFRKIKEQLMSGNKYVTLPGIGRLIVYTRSGYTCVTPLMLRGKLQKGVMEVIDVKPRKTVKLFLSPKFTRMLDE